MRRIGTMTDDRPIVFLLPSLDVGGTERHMVTLANGFASRGRRVEICTFATRDGPLADDVDPAIRVDTLGLLRARYFLGPLRDYLDRVRPRVLVCVMHTAAVFGTLARVLRLTDVPIVIFEGGFANSMPRPALGRAFRAIRTLALYRISSLIITNAQGIADEIVRAARLPLAKVAILPNPLAEEVFEEFRGSPNLASLSVSDPPESDALSWPARYPAVCTVARLNANKDVQLILHAVAVLRSTHAVSLVVIGDGPELERLQALAKHLSIGDDTYFLGWQRHPWRLVRQAAVFVQASRTEGFSNALIEALAVGCPVVATDAPGATRFLLDDGRTGTLVAVGDVNALSAAIARTLDRPQPPAALIARARMLTAASVDAYLAAIDSVSSTKK